MIKLISDTVYGGCTEVTFLVNGIEYTYEVDSAWYEFNSHKYQMKPGTLFNMVKKHGDQIIKEGE